MRAADETTLFRTALVIAVVYLILIKFPSYLTIIIFAIALILDAFDGYFAVWQVSKHKVGIIGYMKATVLNDKKAHDEVVEYKHKVSETARFGPRMDIAGDRVAEYSMWVVFTYLHIIPLIILLLIIIRHSFADAMMGAKGTSSKMKSSFAKAVYSSNASRAVINVLKFITFAYLILVYVNSYPILVGYILVGALFTFIMLRGAAEIYESAKSQ
ncbi:MAG: CDP-alcohol phosphatidyltransferase family protein [Candidatus Micrarchaeia archaeon]